MAAPPLANSSPLPHTRPSLPSTRAPSTSGDNHHFVSANSPQPPPSRTGPTDDDIEAVIQMAMASSTAPRTSNPPRDTRTQLFVGNLPYRVRWQDLKDLFRRAGTVLRADVSLGPDNRSRGYGTVMLATAEDAGRAVDMFNGYTWQTRTLEVRPDRMGEDIAAPGFGIGVGSGSIALASLAGTSALGGVGVYGSPLLGNMSPATGALSGIATPAGGSALLSPAPTISRLSTLPFTTLDEGEPASRPGTGSQTSRNVFVGNLPFHIQWQDLKDLFRQAGAVQRADVALGADGRSRGFGTVSFTNEADAERAVRMFNGYEYNGRPLKVHFDKFAPPASSSAPMVGPTALSNPHSPATFAFSHTQTSPHALSTQVYGQPGSSRASSLAQHLLQTQLEQGRGPTPASLLGSRQVHRYGDVVDNGRQQDISAQVAQKLMFASSSQAAALQQHQAESPQLAHAQAQRQQQQQFARYTPSYIPILPAVQSPYTFDFLHSGPTTPYDVYDLNTYQRLNAVAAGLDGYARAGEQGAQVASQPQTMPSLGYSTAAAAADASQSAPSSGPTKPSPPPMPQASSKSEPGTLGSTGRTLSQSRVSPPSSQPPSQMSPAISARSQPTSNHHHHPAHPGPISLPPPPPVTAFPVPPLHTLSPHYPVSPTMPGGHPMNPLHHPMMAAALGMPMITPHGLPPITPSMPSFTFFPQISPGLPSPVAEPDNRHPPHAHGHMQHVMASYSPFSPGVSMSPGAFWGRAGAGPNPFINPAVGAPVRSGHGHIWFSQQQQTEQQQPHLPHQHVHEQEQTIAGQEQEGRPPDGYFPPVPVSMAMAQQQQGAEEPAGYFPWVPPVQAQVDGYQSTTAEVATNTALNGLVHELERESPSDSDGTATTTRSTGTGTDVGTGTSSSRGTSWHTDPDTTVQKLRAQGADVGGAGAVVEDAPASVVVPRADSNMNVSGSGKPRAYSTEGGAGGPERGTLSRADSDPVKQIPREESS